jgi:hypothetical protein
MKEFMSDQLAKWLVTEKVAKQLWVLLSVDNFDELLNNDK